MKKPSPNKKRNRLLNRRIRRTIGVVFMITAIVVAAIPVPDAVAVVPELTESTQSDTVIAYPNSEIYSKIVSSEYAKPPGLSEDEEYKTYDIKTNSDGTHELEWVFKIWLKEGSGVISDFNTDYNPEGGILKIPNNVVTKYLSFTKNPDIQGVAFEGMNMDDSLASLDGVQDKVDVNLFFGIEMKDDSFDDVDHYELREDGWIFTANSEHMSEEKKEQLYVYKAFKLKDKEVRPVIVDTVGSGNVIEYYPYDTVTGYETEKDGTGTYSINAIGDNAFYIPSDNPEDPNEEGTAKANHIGDLNLQIEDSIVAIGNEAFRGASTLNSITIGARIAEIGARAFMGCTSLKEVNFSNGNTVVGIETFRGCNSLVNVVFEAVTLKTIQDGAFAFCTALESVDISKTNFEGMAVEQFAFYNCQNLNAVTFAPNTTTIGKGCFAVDQANNSLIDIVFPNASSGLKILGESMFEGQSNLKTVTMPVSFGSVNADASDSTLDSDFFKNCIALEELIFPEQNVYASFPADIFKTVKNSNFKVVGPATISSTDEAYSKPRLSAHAAGVPYQYLDPRDGITYLELKYTDKTTGDVIFYRIDDQNQLAAYTSTAAEIDLEIFDKIGNVPITSIKEGCFSDDMKKKLKSVTIHDNSISVIDANLFADSEILSEVYIGDSVTSIGNGAFKNCSELKLISFENPAAEPITIGDNAFRTECGEGTVIQGEITPGYAPYEYAMNPDNKVKDGMQLAYKENRPSNLTVIYDRVAKTKVVADYPLFSSIDDDNRAYKDWFIEHMKSKAESGEESREAVEETIEELINRDRYIEHKVSVKLGEGPIYDDWPSGTGSLYEATDDEVEFYTSITNVKIPAGVTSIDSNAFYDSGDNDGINNNLGHAYVDEEKSGLYHGVFEQGDELPTIHGGLFSGDIKDYSETSDKKDLESYDIGNDRVQTIILTDVISLPDYAFESCENLESVVLGQGLTEMGDSPFAGCSKLASVTGNEKFKVENQIIYEDNGDGTFALVQCLPIRGVKDNLNSKVNLKNDFMLAKVTSIGKGAFKDCTGITDVDLDVVLDLEDAVGITLIPEEAFHGTDELTNVKLPKSVIDIKAGAFTDTIMGLNVRIPNKDTMIESGTFPPGSGTIISYMPGAPYNHTISNKMGFILIDAEYIVTFRDFDGTVLAEVEVTAGEDAVPPKDPIQAGHTFKEWKGDYTNVTENISVSAIYTIVDPNAPDPDDPNADDPDADEDDDDDDDDPTKEYTVKVESGSGSGDYQAGKIINITANASSEGKVFDKWTTSSPGVYFQNFENVTTSLVMPSNDVTITPTYKDPSDDEDEEESSSSSSEDDEEDSTSDSTEEDDGENTTGTTISITKPGVSNKDTASAIVNGSSDDFVIKITESAAAQVAMQKALVEDSATGENIKYFPMDISMYDETGTIKITDTDDISVTITMPIPDELLEYGGNNKMACVDPYNELEILPVSFVTISDVPCIKFTASHFSPYAIYVDTANLTASGITDENPKTGDGIHPKWFIVLALSASSILLFIKKDKKLSVELA